MKLSLINARSIKNKLQELHYYLSNNAPDILCITETWLTSAVTNVVLVGDCDYTVFRKDRTDAVGGGVCILLNNKTVVGTQVNIPSIFSHLELVAADISTSLTKVRLFIGYRPPSSDKDSTAVAYAKDMCSCISNLSRSNYTTLVCGDFNFPSIQWNDNSANNCDNESCSGLFYNFCVTNSLHQLVQDATRLTSSTSNVLDLILCNDLNFVFNVNVTTPFSSCDHCIVNCNLQYNTGI